MASCDSHGRTPTSPLYLKRKNPARVAISNYIHQTRTQSFGVEHGFTTLSNSGFCSKKMSSGITDRDDNRVELKTGITQTRDAKKKGGKAKTFTGNVGVGILVRTWFFLCQWRCLRQHLQSCRTGCGGIKLSLNPYMTP